MAGQEFHQVRRFPDWPERLAAFIETHRNEPFVWGRHDCCTFLSDAAVALTGSDPMAEFRGRYDSETGADAMLGGAPLDDFVGACLARWGAVESSPLMASRGDIVTASPGNHLMFGICAGPHIALPGEDRLVFVPARMALRCWRY